MRTRTIMYIVNWDDPEHTAEGIRKTRHFPTLIEAIRYSSRLSGVKNVQITKQETLTVRTNVTDRAEETGGS